MPESLPPLEVAGRLDRARQHFADAGIDALVVTALNNVRYLSGFSGSAGVMVVTEDRALLTTDGRYRTQSAGEVEAAGVSDQVALAVGGADAQRQAIRDLLVTARAARVGLEADSVTWSAQRRWADLLAGEGGPARSLVATEGLVEALRQVKDPGEVARMAKAAAIADAALADVLDLVGEAGRQEVTERQVALALDAAMRRLGASDRAFDTIVAAGEHSAKPHHQPTDRPLCLGDPVVIDFGAVFDGYRSDMTRTFSLGGPPKGQLARVFQVVGEAQAKGVAAVRRGLGTKELDALCRQVIAEAGWAEAFEHGTGHGVGLDIHEAPTVSPLGTAILEPGVVVTVEPGVYLPGVGGVRVEDTLVVTDEGSRALTAFPKDVAA